MQRTMIIIFTILTSISIIITHYHCSGGGRRDRAVIREPGSRDGLRSTLRAEEEVSGPAQGELGGDDDHDEDDGDDDDDDGDDNDQDDDAEEQVPSPTQGELHHDIFF